MGFFSKLFGGGGGSSQTTNQYNTQHINVDVNPNITVETSQLADTFKPLVSAQVEQIEMEKQKYNYQKELVGNIGKTLDEALDSFGENTIKYGKKALVIGGAVFLIYIWSKK